MDRAYSTLEIKSFDTEQRIIEGYASTPATDRRGDVMDPAGAQFTLPMPLLWQHQQALPVGEVTAARVLPDGIHITAKFTQVTEPGTLRDRLDEAWQSVKARLVRGLSVGFKPLELTPLKGGGFHVKKWEWAETSAVTIPMNVAATILNIKSAALSLDQSGAADLPTVRVRNTPPMNQTYAEQIAQHEAKRATVVASMADLMKKSNDDGTTLSADDTKVYDGHSAEVRSLDGHITRLREMESLNVLQAKPVVEQRHTPVVQVKSLLPKGTAFTRVVMATAAARGDSHRAIEWAKQWKDSTPEVELMLKAAVAPGTTTDPAWAGALAQVQNLQDEFIDMLRPATILGRIPNLHRVPFNVSVPLQNAGGTYSWVGQGAAKPVTKPGYGSVQLLFHKIAGIIVLTEELVKVSSPSAEDAVRREMIAGISQFMDQQFIDPTVAAVAGVSPGSITNGAGSYTTTGSALGDIHQMALAFAAAGIPLAGATVVMSEANAFTLSLTRDTFNNRLFPDMTAAGGTAEGLNVVASNAAGSNVVLLQGSYVLYADEGGVQVDVSREATVMMDSAPVAGTTALTPLWQNNLVGLRAERMTTWKRAVDNAVKYTTGAAYVPTPPAALGALGTEPPSRDRK